MANATYTRIYRTTTAEERAERRQRITEMREAGMSYAAIARIYRTYPAHIRAMYLGRQD